MKELLTFVLVVTRIYIAAKIGYLLYMTNVNPLMYPLESLTWWIYFLVFDMWLLSIIPDNKSNGSQDS